MSQKSSILADYYGNILLKEVRGISFEVRAWANIIKDVIDAEYQKYLDDFNARRKTQYPMYYGPVSDSAFYGGRSLRFDQYDFDDVAGFYSMYDRMKKQQQLTEDDLAVMNQNEVDAILETILNYYDFPFEKIVDLTPSEIVALYNQTLNKPKLNEADEINQPPIQRPTQIIINGADYPEAFANFGVDKWVISDKKPTEYDHVNSGYQPNDEYTVYINCDFSSNISLFVLIHEIKHAYQDWQRISKNKPPLRQSKELLQLYTKDFERFILSHSGGYHLKTLDSVISGYYMSSNAEITAYLESAYDDMYPKTTNDQPIIKLYDLGKNMVQFKAAQVELNTPPQTLQKRWTKINQDYDIPLFRKFTNVFDFLKYTEKFFNKKGRLIVKKINKLRTIEV